MAASQVSNQRLASLRSGLLAAMIGFTGRDGRNTQLAHLKSNPTANALLKGNPLKLKVTKQGKDLLFDGIVHRSGKALLLEL